MGGIPITNKVLIHPQTTVTNIKLPDGFERSDAFATSRNKEIDNMNPAKVLLSTVTFVTKELARDIAEELVKAHKPISFDYTKKYKISQKNPIIKTKNTGKIIDTKVIKCPRCKEGDLVQRKRKSKKFGDQYQSDQFLGCSRFPKYRYTEEIES